MREGEKRIVSRVLSLHNSTSFFSPHPCPQCLVSCLVCTGVGWKGLDFDKTDKTKNEIIRYSERGNGRNQSIKTNRETGILGSIVLPIRKRPETEPQRERRRPSRGERDGGRVAERETVLPIL